MKTQSYYACEAFVRPLDSLPNYVAPISTNERRFSLQRGTFTLSRAYGGIGVRRAIIGRIV